MSNDPALDRVIAHGQCLRHGGVQPLNTEQFSAQQFSGMRDLGVHHEADGAHIWLVESGKHSRIREYVAHAADDGQPQLSEPEIYELPGRVDAWTRVPVPDPSLAEAARTVVAVEQLQGNGEARAGLFVLVGRGRTPHAVALRARRPEDSHFPGIVAMTAIERPRMSVVVVACRDRSLRLLRLELGRAGEAPSFETVAVFEDWPFMADWLFVEPDQKKIVCASRFGVCTRLVVTAQLEFHLVSESGTRPEHCASEPAQCALLWSPPEVVARGTVLFGTRRGLMAKGAYERAPRLVPGLEGAVTSLAAVDLGGQLHLCMGGDAGALELVPSAALVGLLANKDKPVGEAARRARMRQTWVVALDDGPDARGPRPAPARWRRRELKRCSSLSTMVGWNCQGWVGLTALDQSGVVHWSQITELDVVDPESAWQPPLAPDAATLARFSSRVSGLSPDARASLAVAMARLGGNLQHADAWLEILVGCLPDCDAFEIEQVSEDAFAECSRATALIELSRAIVVAASGRISSTQIAQLETGLVRALHRASVPMPSAEREAVRAWIELLQCHWCRDGSTTHAGGTWPEFAELQACLRRVAAATPTRETGETRPTGATLQYGEGECEGEDGGVECLADGSGWMHGSAASTGFELSGPGIRSFVTSPGHWAVGRDASGHCHHWLGLAETEAGLRWCTASLPATGGRQKVRLLEGEAEAASVRLGDCVLATTREGVFLRLSRRGLEVWNVADAASIAARPGFASPEGIGPCCAGPRLPDGRQSFAATLSGGRVLVGCVDLERSSAAPWSIELLSLGEGCVAELALAGAHSAATAQELLLAVRTRDGRLILRAVEAPGSGMALVRDVGVECMPRLAAGMRFVGAASQRGLWVAGAGLRKYRITRTGVELVFEAVIPDLADLEIAAIDAHDRLRLVDASGSEIELDAGPRALVPSATQLWQLAQKAVTVCEQKFSGSVEGWRRWVAALCGPNHEPTRARIGSWLAQAWVDRDQGESWPSMSCLRICESQARAPRALRPWRYWAAELGQLLQSRGLERELVAQLLDDAPASFAPDAIRRVLTPKAMALYVADDELRIQLWQFLRAACATGESELGMACARALAGYAEVLHPGPAHAQVFEFVLSLCADTPARSGRHPVLETLAEALRSTIEGDADVAVALVAEVAEKIQDAGCERAISEIIARSSEGQVVDAAALVWGVAGGRKGPKAARILANTRASLQSSGNARTRVEGLELRTRFFEAAEAARGLSDLADLPDVETAGTAQPATIRSLRAYGVALASFEQGVRGGALSSDSARPPCDEAFGLVGVEHSHALRLADQHAVARARACVDRWRNWAAQAVAQGRAGAASATSATCDAGASEGVACHRPNGKPEHEIEAAGHSRADGTGQVVQVVQAGRVGL